MDLSFIFNAVIPAILPTIIIKKFIITPLIEYKLLCRWCNKNDKLKFYLDANVSKNHPRVKELLKEEEESYQEMIEFSPGLKKK